MAFGQHQIPAVIVAVAQHSRLRRQRADEVAQLGPERIAIAHGKHDASIRFQEMLDEKIHLPGELLDIERNRVPDVPGILQFTPAPLHRFDEPDRLPIERRMRRRGRRTDMGLQCDVTEIIEGQHAVVRGLTQDRRHRQSHRRKQLGHVHEGKGFVVERARH